MSITEGTKLEYRVKRMLFYQGYFARRGVSLRSYFYPDMVEVTDIDVLGLRFDKDFRQYTIICECLSGRTDHDVDRLLWLKGLSNYFHADQEYFVREQMSPKVKNFASSFGIMPLDLKRLEELEKTFGPSDYIGSHDYVFFFPFIKNNYAEMRRISSLMRVYWFTKSRFWYTENPSRLLRSLSAVETLAEYINHPKPIIKDIAKWLIYDIIILFSISALELCRDTYMLTNIERPAVIENKLTYGKLSPEEHQKILDRSLMLAKVILKERTGQTMLIDNQEVKTHPPKYVPALIDLIERFLEKPEISIQVPRFLDFYLYELLKGSIIKEDKLRELFYVDIPILAKMAKNVIWFICKERNIPEILFDPLLKL